MLTLVAMGCASLPVDTGCVPLNAKSDFMGRASYYVELSTGETSVPTEVWWAIDEEFLLAFGAEEAGPLLAFPIVSHVDGELVEAPPESCRYRLSESPTVPVWNQRELMRVDWSQELTGAAAATILSETIEPVSLFVRGIDDIPPPVDEYDSRQRLSRLERTTRYWRPDTEEVVMGRHVVSWE